MHPDRQEALIPNEPLHSEESNSDITNIISKLEQLHDRIEPRKNQKPKEELEILNCSIAQRIDFFAKSALTTTEKSLNEINKATDMLRSWMVNGTIVRLIGGGRAKIAGAIPANRLAHGGARVYIVDDLIPMPHSYKQGGIIAVSASGRNPVVIENLKRIRENKTGIFVIGIANHEASEFRKLCDIFIGVRLIEQTTTLQALADTEEYVISMLLDTMVVAAGKSAGFDDTTWRLGHENLGPSGPYDVHMLHPIEWDEQVEWSTFRGRAKELTELKKWFEEFFNQDNKKPNVMCLSGKPGVGKRSLAHRISEEDYIKNNFKRIIKLSAYNSDRDKPADNSDWDKLVLQIARRILDNKLPPNARVSELEEEIIKSAKDKKILLIIDNVDQWEDKFLAFLKRWHDARSSMVLLTVQGEALRIEKEIENCSIKKLKGIDEQGLIEDLIGKVVMNRIDNFGLHEMIELIDGNPAKLLYLRWRSPETKKEIEKCMKDLTDGSQEQSQTFIDPILKTINLPIDHFLSLGLLRSPVFDEGLLAYLWDRLDRGGTGLYTTTLRALITSRLLEYEDRDNLQLRLSTSIHAQLCNLAHSREKEREQRNLVDYFIAQYFRTRFADSRRARFDLVALENYTYHYSRFGKVENACDYIFDAKIIDDAFDKGLSLEIEPILKHLETGLKAKLEPVGEEQLTEARVAHLKIMLARVKMNLGHVYKDLSRHEEALSHLNSALKLLKDFEGSNVPYPEIRPLLSEIEHYRGIAYSQMGYTIECIESYFMSIQHANAIKSFGARDALSLGYIAYELKFHDMEEAQRVGEWSVEFSEKIGDKNLLTKNLCNLGQILSFGGKFRESENMFSKAKELCVSDGVDTRTHCRILVNSAVTFIGLGDLKKASEAIEEAIRLFGEAGDRRRKSMAKAYSGIIHLHQGKKDLSRKLIKEALIEHLNAGAEREIIYEVLSLAWIEHGDELPKGPDILADLEYLSKETRDKINSSLKSDKLSVFMRFWKKYYCPVLLKSHLGN
jgi:tetratricopeptide (TPR) repeat protein/D-arabinose 5-phosphate isomerase GutQ